MKKGLVEVNGIEVKTLYQGMNMKEFLENKIKEVQDKVTFIYVGKVNLEEEGFSSYIEETREAINVENYNLSKFEGETYFGYCPSQYVYLYK